MSSTHGTAVSSMASLMAVQFLSRMLHFIMNPIIMHYLSAAKYGITNLQVPLVTVSITRIVKEALHRASVTSQKKGEKSGENYVLLWLCFPIAVIISCSLTFMFVRFWAADEISQNPWILIALACWSIFSWIEILIEPVIIYLEVEMQMQVVMIVECSALLIESASILLSLWMLPSAELVSAVGQLVLGIATLIGYYFYAFVWNPECWKSIWPKSFKITDESWQRLKGFLTPALGKYIAAEGQQLILFFFANSHQQGVYQFVSNIGSLIPRIVFQSIEKTAFAMFSNMKSQIQPTNNKNSSEEEKASQEKMKSVWNLLTQVALLITMTYLCTCPTYIYFLVNLIYGSKWSETEAPTLLIVYGIYMLLLAINGLVEASRDALSPSELLQKQSGFVFVLVVVQLVLGAIGLYFFGAFGLLIAAAITTFIRMIFNFSVFQKFIPSGLIDLMPPTKELAFYAFILLTGQTARFLIGDNFKLFAFGIFQGLLYLGWIFMVKRHTLLAARSLVSKKQIDEKKEK